MSDMKLKLTPSDRDLLELAYRATREKRLANRTNALLLLDEGYEYKEVADILRLDEDTIRRIEQAHIELGTGAFLESPYKGGTSKLTAIQLEELAAELEVNLYQTTAEVCAFVEKNFGVQYTTSGMAELLKRLGFVFKKPCLVPGKLDPQLQEEFVEYYEAIRAQQGEKDKIYFVDGVHAQHNSKADYGWIRKGEERLLESNSGRQRININGALDPDTLEVIAKADETLNAQATIDFFKLIEDRNPQANKIVLIIDNARYYFNADVYAYVQNSSQLEMVFLPPYSPNLNLIERLWKFMKKKVINNRYHETFKDFKHAIGTFFERIPEYYDELSQLMTEDFQSFAV
jgi:transposase